MLTALISLFFIYLFSSAIYGSAVWPSALDDKMSTQGEIKCSQCHERLNVDLKKRLRTSYSAFARLQLNMVKLASLLVIFSLILTGKLHVSLKQKCCILGCVLCWLLHAAFAEQSVGSLLVFGPFKQERGISQLWKCTQGHGHVRTSGFSNVTAWLWKKRKRRRRGI